ncbi:MAG: glutamyl-tRNA reductase [Proteobacteria bacterium]|nr:glutamyl-tRNA reductase [Pseudomonadota bacterium]
MSDQEKNYFSVGFNHDTCPLDLRAALAIGDHEIDLALKSLQKVQGVSESVILSTCNRTEIYSVAANLDAILRWFIDFRGVSDKNIIPVLYKYQDELVVQHAFRVAAGLDSMVLGETQILGQLKNSVREAESAGTLGPKLRRLFDVSFSVAKHIRTETNVGAHSVSLAAASAKVGERIFGSLSHSNVLFIGAGEMSRICAEYFASLDVQGISFANRTLSRAKDLACTFKGNFFPLGDVFHKLGEFDIVVSCTGSPIPIVGKKAIEKAIETRRHKPILLIDLAVPRDIELEASDLEDVFLYTVDDLGEIVKDGVKNREEAAQHAEKIIQERLIQFKSQVAREKIVPVIKKFRKHGESIMEGELNKALLLIAKGEAPETVLTSLSRAITNKFMHHPSRVLNDESSDLKVDLGEALEKLYGLDKD